jgi:hypothetical protein
MQVAQCAVLRYVPTRRVILLRVQHCTAAAPDLQVQSNRLSSSLTKRNEGTLQYSSKKDGSAGSPFPLTSCGDNFSVFGLVA